jgi:hypothetical protein
MHILIGLIIIGIGALIVVKTEAILNSFGRIYFFEKYLGTEGGSRLGYKLIGIAAVFIGALIMTNLIGDLLSWVFSPLFRFSAPGGGIGTSRF